MDDDSWLFLKAVSGFGEVSKMQEAVQIVSTLLDVTTQYFETHVGKTTSWRCMI